MYTVSKGPSKIVAKTRRGLSQNYEKFETIKESGKRSSDLYSPEKNNVPRPVFQRVTRTAQPFKMEEEVITPQHADLIKYIHDSWDAIVAQNPYDGSVISKDIEYNGSTNGTNGVANGGSKGVTNGSAKPCAANSSTASSANSSEVSSAASSASSSPQPVGGFYCIEPPSPVLSDFKPFDLETWWGRRLFNNITKSL